MNKTKVLTVAILGFLSFFAFLSLFNNDKKKRNEEFLQYIENAENYSQRGLYQLSIAEYQKAIEVNDSIEVREKMFEMYEKRLKESKDIIDDYVEALEDTIRQYPKTVKFYMQLAETYERMDNLHNAYKVLNKAVEMGLEDKEIKALMIHIEGIHEIAWNEYEKVGSFNGSTCPIMVEGRWGSIDQQGNYVDDNMYEFISIEGEEGVRILCGEEKILVDEEEVVRGKLNFVPQDALAYSEGLIAIHNGSSYGYYNSLGDYLFGKYAKASCFTDGKALISEDGKKWKVIDANGEVQSDFAFDDIVISPIGEYAVDGHMLVKDKDKYVIIDMDGKQVGNFTCNDVDVLTKDGVIAYKGKDKWGFVNVKGEVVIEEKYERAKSFSNGYAAVCMGGKWGVINSNGDVIIEPEFEDIDYFNEEHCCFVQRYVIVPDIAPSLDIDFDLDFDEDLEEILEEVQEELETESEEEEELETESEDEELETESEEEEELETESVEEVESESVEESEEELVTETETEPEPAEIKWQLLTLQLK